MAYQSYDYTWEMISLVARIVLTIALELGIVLLVGYREKKVLVFLAVINIITQVTLNVAAVAEAINGGEFIFDPNGNLIYGKE